MQASFWDPIFSYVGSSTAILMDVGWHSLCPPTPYYRPCRLLGGMSIRVLFLLKRLWICYRCWPARFGCILGSNAVIRCDLADIFSHSIKVSAGFFYSYMYYFCVCLSMIPLIALLSQRTACGCLSFLPLCGSAALDPIVLQVWEQALYPLSHLLSSGFNLWHC